VGLAEISSANPLKVLHSLLEVTVFERDPERPAVVGISNWSLDAAKMNRAVHIARPEPDEEQLVHTAEAILDSMDCRLTPEVIRSVKGLAAAFTEYRTEQLRAVAHGNFHGLRDFYWTVRHVAKSLREDGRLTPHAMARAVARNFSGLEHGRLTALDRWLTEMAGDGQNPLRSQEVCGVRQLIRDNLTDPECRHLMLLTSGNAILNAVEGLFQEAGLAAPRVMIGSKLPGDQCEAYHYRVLSEIIECLETGRSLVLKDLDNVYGSLYDMLNQAYTVVAGKRHCRIALGAFSNPLCLVADGVKVVVVVDQERALEHDPPFVSRFEKQPCRFTYLLDANRRVTLRALDRWVQAVSTLADADCPRAAFGARDLFTGHTESGLESLLATVPVDSSCDVAEEFQKRLLRTASADGVIRVLASELEQSPEERWRLVGDYFKDEGHANLSAYLRLHALRETGTRPVFKAVVTTFTSLHLFRAEAHLPADVRHQHRQLGSFDSEAALGDTVRSFFASPAEQLLVFECHGVYDRAHILLARFLVDAEAAEYTGDRKVVVFLVHVGRVQFADDGPGAEWETIFTEGWDCFHVDNLLLSDSQWEDLRGLLDVQDLRTVVSADGLLEEVVRSELMACFRRFRYGVLADPDMSTAECGG
jgi:E3 ubiquitin-protein ligase RNF213